MRLSALGTSRVRFLALLLVASFSFAAIGATTIASATDASAAKKCKKGYKKVGKKCKKKSTKKQSTPKHSTAVVRAVNVYQGQMVGSDLEIMGDVQTNTHLIGLKTVTLTVVSSSGTQTFTRTAQGWGRTEVNYTVLLPVTGVLPLHVTAVVEGVTSNTLTVTR